MAGRIDQVQQILLAVFGFVGQRYGIAFDCDATFAFDIHRIEHLILKLTLCHTAASLNQSIRKRRLAVVNMSDNAEVSSVFHAPIGFDQGEGHRMDAFAVLILMNHRRIGQDAE